MEAREEAAFTQQRQQNETVLNTLEILVLSNQGQELGGGGPSIMTRGAES